MSLQIRDGKPGLFYDCAPDKDSEFWEIQMASKVNDRYFLRLRNYGEVEVCEHTYSDALKALTA